MVASTSSRVSIDGSTPCSSSTSSETCSFFFRDEVVRGAIEEGAYVFDRFAARHVLPGLHENLLHEIKRILALVDPKETMAKNRIRKRFVRL